MKSPYSQSVSKESISTHLAYLHVRNAVCEWEAHEELKRKAIKEIQAALKLFRKNGAINM